MLSNVLIGAIIVVFCVNVQSIDTLNVLGIFPFEGKSHFFVFKSLLEELAKRGHNVTVISHFPREKLLKNYHDISLAGTAKIVEDDFPILRNYKTIISDTIFVTSTGVANCELMLENENVQHLWKTHTKFDVAIVEQFNSDCSLGLAYKLKTPVVGVNSHVLLPWHYSRFGIPHNPSYVSAQFLGGGTNPTLYQRVERTIFNFYAQLLYKYYAQRSNEKTLARHFGDGIPSLEDLGREIKILLHYNYFILTGSRLLPANVIEVAGYHIAQPKVLPDEIRNFIEESVHGVIYISFGSTVKASTLSNKKQEVITNTLSKLPQRVIWKWNEKSLPANSKNIFASEWLPQNDILAHPNVLAFFSHCGNLGTVEAVTFGVPILGMPIHGDQASNAAAIEESGFGIQMDLEDLTEENLGKNFRTILNNQFRERVKTLSKSFRDRPMSAMDTAIYWIEFAARYPNSTFRAKSADVPLYQYLCLDVIVVFACIILLIILIIKVLIQLCSAKESQTMSSEKKSKRE